MMALYVISEGRLYNDVQTVLVTDGIRIQFYIMVQIRAPEFTNHQTRLALSPVPTFLVVTLTKFYALALWVLR